MQVRKLYIYLLSDLIYVSAFTIYMIHCQSSFKMSCYDAQKSVVNYSDGSLLRNTLDLHRHNTCTTKCTEEVNVNLYKNCNSIDYD